MRTRPNHRSMERDGRSRNFQTTGGTISIPVECKTVKMREIVTRFVCGEAPEGWDVIEEILPVGDEG